MSRLYIKTGKQAFFFSEQGSHEAVYPAPHLIRVPVYAKLQAMNGKVLFIKTKTGVEVIHLEASGQIFQGSLPNPPFTPGLYFRLIGRGGQWVVHAARERKVQFCLPTPELKLPRGQKTIHIHQRNFQFSVYLRLRGFHILGMIGRLDGDSVKKFCAKQLYIQTITMGRDRARRITVIDIMPA